jgi:dTDP-4-dehydrorhamnose reductase
MRILVTGAAGMLGHALAPVLEERHQGVRLTGSDCDLCNESAVREIFQLQKPDIVMHLAAFTNVDACEREPEKATEQNAVATRNVASAAKHVGAAVLYTSTDYVFGRDLGRPYREDDPPSPLNVYGRSKLLGEQHVQEILLLYFIVRTSWLFGPRGRNCVSTILRIAGEKKELRVVNDQRGSPTYTRHLATKLEELVTSGEYGVYHINGAGSCTWFEFAQKIVEFSGIKGVSLTPVSSCEYVCDAARPAYSVLANGRLGELGIGLLPHWETGLKDYLKELQNGEERRDKSTGTRSAYASFV